MADRATRRYRMLLIGFGLLMAGFCLSLTLHVALFWLRWWQPYQELVLWLYILLAYSYFLLRWLRSRRKATTAPAAPRSSGGWWGESVAEFRRSPFWARPIYLLLLALMIYALAVLVLAPLRIPFANLWPGWQAAIYTVLGAFYCALGALDRAEQLGWWNWWSKPGPGVAPPG